MTHKIGKKSCPWRGLFAVFLEEVGDAEGLGVVVALKVVDAEGFHLVGHFFCFYAFGGDHEAQGMHGGDEVRKVGVGMAAVDGVILLVIFAVYLFWMIQSAKKARTSGDKLEAEEEALAEEEIKILPMWKCMVFIIGGMIAIKFGGDFVVDGASAIAAGFGLSQTLIGLTIVALGTSLPELVTSIVAARKDEVDMALGNVIGSNIFNILLILGVAAAISPIAFLMENIIDIIILIIMSVVVWGFAWTSRKINRTEGIIMLLMYAVYMVYICMR